ncbi:glycoside hydrolase family 88 protein [Vitiosangium sp. GDMCC 1.1324]|uniref:glycoside hydrolase family 88 protein n=1 Tax=Vitiosangium sp. (strain GDMCC 1.1324) TaxID=2138576 RepID=UPI000D3A7E8C|nr:glycoside hydrolase family 88 protein [Vitiosangium sp. GDMCC 1.1324]PTL85853.1 glucuronylhydrolase [Vitiosangium sp. GDMCC 1.1324]
MKKPLVASLLLVLSVLSWPRAQASSADPFRATIPDTLQFAEKQLRATANALPLSAYPSSTALDGSWDTTGSGSWTSGFLSGTFWYMYQYTRNPFWRLQAEQWQTGLESQKFRTDDQDLGFMILDSYGHGYRQTGNDTYRQVVLTAAESLAQRFDPNLGYIRSRGDLSDTEDFRVIIDTLMNSELLFWGARNGGGREWYDMAHQHALHVLETHVREDGSTLQTVSIDPRTGTIQEQSKEQGCRWNTTWARGQAWAVYGFTMAYRETHDPRLLQAARRTADYFLQHLPADKVPYWDLEVPHRSQEPRDSSAAAIVASALVELSQLENQPRRAARYWYAARDILISLSSPAYLTRHKQSRSILRHGTAYKPHDKYDTGLIQGDYFFIEALLRYSSARPPARAAWTPPGEAEAPLSRRGEDPSMGTDDVSLSFSLRLMSLPSEDAGLPSHEGDLMGHLLVRPSGELALSNGEIEIGARSIPLKVGQAYRILLRQKKDSGPYTILEAYLAREGEDFECPFVSSRVVLSSPASGPPRSAALAPLDAIVEDLEVHPAPR